MKKRSILLLMLLFVGCVMQSALAQTYAYKVSHSVQDDVKIAGVVSKGTVFYFTFTKGKSMCYLTNKSGVYESAYGQNSYRYIGKRNGIRVYEECNQNMFKARNQQDMLYFADDYSRLNWDNGFDNFQNNGGTIIRVLNYVSDPDEVEVPSELY
ncbi:hypothetical protein [Bacteroides sp.]|uniref:hypothetical protein n=1 Tax=Bacteroides sp. TaxID=29523 RepID=UPI00262D7F43|nr:hypothetical protein [Bacteroides sp.]